MFRRSSSEKICNNYSILEELKFPNIYALAVKKMLEAISLIRKMSGNVLATSGE